MSKLLFFDLETTGVKFWRNGIHQIGGIVDIDGQEAERFDIRLAPNPAATIEHEEEMRFCKDLNDLRCEMLIDMAKKIEEYLLQDI